MKFETRFSDAEVESYLSLFAGSESKGQRMLREYLALRKLVAGLPDPVDEAKLKTAAWDDGYSVGKLVGMANKPATEPLTEVPPLALAIRFHEIYERLAPSFGYETRADTKAFDPTSKNGKLMTAVCGEIINAYRVGPPVLIPQLTTDPPKCFRCGRPEGQHGNAWHDCLVFVPPTPSPQPSGLASELAQLDDDSVGAGHPYGKSPAPAADMQQLRNVAAWAVHHHAYGGIHDSKSILKGNADRRIKEAAAGDLGKSAPDPEQDCKCPVCSPAHTAEQILIDATLEISEARKDFNTLDERPEQVITITRHGRPVFAVVKLNYLEVLQRPASIAQPTADQAGEIDPMRFQAACAFGAAMLSRASIAELETTDGYSAAECVEDGLIYADALISALRKRGNS